MKINNIKDKFIEFFKSKGHMYLESALLSTNDPTLLFINSGMAPLKDYFLNNATPPAKALVTCQSCLRVGGKHNDIDNIGHSKRHHTFFQMMGNFSFGAYSRLDAMKYAIEFLREIKLYDKLFFTYHIDDIDAQNILFNLVNHERIIALNNDDNKWSMGNYGPFGYSIEIFYSEQEKYNEKIFDNEFVEIWNIVYMTHEQTKNGIKLLPCACIDTGMGLERIYSILEGYKDTYLSSIFNKYFNLLEPFIKINKLDYRQRIIVDHIRSVQALLPENIIPSSTGHGYILRMLIRRIITNIYLIDQNIIYDLIKKIFNNILVLSELESFMKCIDQGIKMINQNMSDQDIFKLYETYGLPIEISETMLGHVVDIEKFKLAHQEISKSNMQDNVIDKIPNINTRFVGYNQTYIKCRILKYIEMDKKYIILDQTVFYPESGGQVSDNGYIEYNEKKIHILNVTYRNNVILHEIEDKIEENIEVIAYINIKRRNNLSKAHSATHILNYILRNKYNAKQSGSLVRENELRFDVICSYNIDEINIKEIEYDVNKWILSGYNTQFKKENTQLAIKRGVTALLSEKYPEISNVIKIFDSEELCCGTHIRNTNEIEYFIISSIRSISKNILRIEAFISEKAYEYLYNIRNITNKISILFACKENEILYKIALLKHNLKDMQMQNNKLQNTLLRYSVKEKIYQDTIYTVYTEYGSIQDLPKLINSHYKTSIISSPNAILIKSKDKIDKYVKSIQEIFPGSGGGNEYYFKGAYFIKDFNKFQDWLDKIIV